MATSTTIDQRSKAVRVPSGAVGRGGGWPARTFAAWTGPGALSQLVLAFGVCVVVGGWLCAQAGARTTPPAVPACFSQVGICEGVPLKSVIAPTKLTAPENGNGLFKLKGPAPLQSTQPVACGDICIYNHLNWYQAGGVIKRGCGVNQTTCDIRITPGADRWVPVVVTQNDYPVALFLLWARARKPGIYVVSGLFLRQECVNSRGARGCKVREVPQYSGRVEAVGAGRTLQTHTDATGHYSFEVRKGWYSIVAGGGVGVDPQRRVLDVRADTPDVNFLDCARPSLAVAPTNKCDLVEIDGRTVDVLGKPYKLADVSTFGDITTSDANGDFVLFVPRGRQTITADRAYKGYHLTPTGSLKVNATERLQNVVILIHPTLVTLSPTSGYDVEVQVAGLPPNRTYVLTANAPHVPGGGSCNETAQSIEFTLGALRIDAFDWKAGDFLTPLCGPATFTAVLADATPDHPSSIDVLAQSTFLISNPPAALP